MRAVMLMFRWKRWYALQCFESGQFLTRSGSVKILWINFCGICSFYISRNLILPCKGHFKPLKAGFARVLIRILTKEMKILNEWVIRIRNNGSKNSILHIFNILCWPQDHAPEGRFMEPELLFGALQPYKFLFFYATQGYIFSSGVIFPPPFLENHFFFTF